MTIRVLSPEVAIRIAAGEVVERPASVVKELVENALDAGARTIHVECLDGGRRLIRVVDDGCGIPPGDLELAFARHATSKLSQIEDLEHIATLGFRGEALASVAAVSQITLVSRSSDEQSGALIRLEGGSIAHQERRGHPAGTAVTVEDLFYNTPARRKFLRTPATERRHITTLVTRYAMAYPEVRFTVIHDGRPAFQSTGRGDLRDVCIEAFGVEVAKELLPVVAKGDGLVGVEGLVSPPAVHRASRDQLSFFVNRRWIQDRMLAYALEEAYHTLLPTGRHPIAVLSLSMDPGQVDVNVHPAKSEVRFRDTSSVFRAVQRAVRATLIGSAPIPAVRLGGQVGGRFVDAHSADGHLLDAHRWEAIRRPELATRAQLSLIPPRFEEATEGQRLPPLRVVGQIGQAYIIAEGPGGMYLIDQHAAHERVLYEQLLSQEQRSSLVSQRLLSPQVVEMTMEQQATLSQHAGQLDDLGFDLEPFGGQTVLIRALPTLLQQGDPAQTLAAILDDLAAASEPLARDIEDRLIATVCKQAAVKAGQTLSIEEMQGLVQQLEDTTMPRTCPHGRPTMIHLSQAQLEREFGRG